MSELEGMDYIRQLKRDEQFDAVRALVLSGQVETCPACFGYRWLEDWYESEYPGAVVYEEIECPLCAPEPQRAPVVVTQDEEIPL